MLLRTRVAALAQVSYLARKSHAESDTQRPLFEAKQTPMLRHGNHRF
jgi:hypothetical protein